MKKGLTEIVFILDRSGSMRGLEQDTIGGFNSLIKKQRNEEGEAYISTILFDNFSEVLHDRLPLDKINEMTEKEYFVRGSTALLDAIGGAIHHISHIHKYAREEDRPEKTLFIITTDGMENSSRNYSYEKVKELVEKQNKEYGWEFLFLGANIDAIEEANKFGIGADRAVNYHCDKEGTAVNYNSLNKAISSVRRCRGVGAMKEALSNWDEDIRDDFSKRNSCCLQNDIELKEAFERNGFRKKVDSNKKIHLWVNDEEYIFDYETNKMFIISKEDIRFAMCVREKKRYLFINKSYNIDTDDYTRPYRTFYDGLMKEPFNLCYPFDKPVIIYPKKRIKLRFEIVNS